MACSQCEARWLMGATGPCDGCEKDTRIAELEAENRMLSSATRSVEDWEMERCFRVRAERRVKELEAALAAARKESV